MQAACLFSDEARWQHAHHGDRSSEEGPSRREINSLLWAQVLWSQHEEDVLLWNGTLCEQS
jgi:hypothetical protein